MRARQSAVKKYVVKLCAKERERLLALIRSGKHPSRKLMRAHILLKADASAVGEAWSDSQIANAFDTGLATVARIRQQLVEEGVEGVLTPKRSPNSAASGSSMVPARPSSLRSPAQTPRQATHVGRSSYWRTASLN